MSAADTHLRDILLGQTLLHAQLADDRAGRLAGLFCQVPERGLVRLDGVAVTDADGRDLTAMHAAAVSDPDADQLQIEEVFAALERTLIGALICAVDGGAGGAVTLHLAFGATITAADARWTVDDRPAIEPLLAAHRAGACGCLLASDGSVIDSCDDPGCRYDDLHAELAWADDRPDADTIGGVCSRCDELVAPLGVAGFYEQCGCCRDDRPAATSAADTDA